MPRRARLLLVIVFATLSGAGLFSQESSKPRQFVFAADPRQFSLDPLHTFTAFESQFYTAIYEGLLVNDPLTLEPTPAMASRWEVSADGRMYRFFLRPNAVYSNGRQVRAQDFVDSWLRMLDPVSKAEYSVLFDPIKGARAYRTGAEKDPKKVGVRAVADKTLEVELEKPAAYFLKLVCHISFLPIYPGYMQSKDWGAGKTVIGNGPFVMTKRSDTEILLEKNKLYWDAANVALDSIRVLFIEDAAKATDDFLAGKIDWSTVFPTSKAQGSDKVVVYPMFATSYFSFVCDKAPWSDWRVRRALALLVPWDQIRSTDNFLFPDSRLVPSIPQYPDVKGIDAVQPDEAMKLLSDAGFPQGKGLSALIIKIGGSGAAEIGGKMADAWKSAIGLMVDVQVVQGGDYFSQIRKADFAVGFSTWIGDYADPLTFLQLWTSDSNLNDARFSDAGYDSAVNDSISIQDAAERYTKLAQAEEILLSQAVILPVAHSAAVHLIDLDGVDGWYPNPLDVHPFKFIGFKQHKAPAGVAMLP
jgi:oligopeptide transport system substrate-binding protein